MATKAHEIKILKEAKKIVQQYCGCSIVCMCIAGRTVSGLDSLAEKLEEE